MSLGTLLEPKTRKQRTIDRLLRQFSLNPNESNAYELFRGLQASYATVTAYKKDLRVRFVSYRSMEMYLRSPHIVKGEATIVVGRPPPANEDDVFSRQDAIAYIHNKTGQPILMLGNGTPKPNIVPLEHIVKIDIERGKETHCENIPVSLVEKEVERLKQEKREAAYARKLYR